jgi:hypothetical protein
MTEEKEAKKFESDKIWAEIKDLSIEMFSLPNQKVSDHVFKVNLPGKKLTVTLKSSSVLTSLEYVLGKKFEVEPQEKYVTIARAVKEVELEDELAEVVVANTVMKNKLAK